MMPQSLPDSRRHSLSRTDFVRYVVIAVAVTLLTPLAAGAQGAATPADAAAHERAERQDRISASFLLARGRIPTPAELVEWSAGVPSSMADLLQRHRAVLARDEAARRDAAERARLDAVGGQETPAVEGLTYTEQVLGFVRALHARRPDYERVLNRAYRTVLGRDAFSQEVEYWMRRPPLGYAFLAASLHDWARRNQPGLTVTAGVPSAAMNNPYLVTIRLSPALASEARVAAGLERPGPAVFARHIVAAGAASVASVGGVHLVAAGAADRLR